MILDTRTTHMYPIMIVASFLVGAAVQYRLHTKRGIRKDIAWLSVLSGVFFSAVCGLLLTFITSLGKQIGFSSLGGLAGMYLGGLLPAKFSQQPYYPTMTAQNCTLVLPLMYSVAKIGCLCAGCCRGIPYTGFGSVTYLLEDGTVTVLPVQLLETVSFLLLFVFGIVMFRRHSPKTFHLLFLLALLTKWALDFLRESHIGKVQSMTQILCLLLAAGDLAAIAVMIMHKKK